MPFYAAPIHTTRHSARRACEQLSINVGMVDVRRSNGQRWMVTYAGMDQVARFIARPCDGIQAEPMVGSLNEVLGWLFS